MNFTQDFITQHLPQWDKLPVCPTILDIGTFEGSSAVWFYDNLCPDYLVTVDPKPKPIAEENFGGRDIQQVRLSSHEYLRDTVRTFDLIYIDGSHRGEDVLEDAILSYRVLEPRGFLIFDDYFWRVPRCEEYWAPPKVGIDAFLNLFGPKFETIHSGYQIILRLK